MKRSGEQEGGEKKETYVPPLCASCDRCRARKTRCDGQRPCGNCQVKYMKKYKVNSVEGVELSAFDCVYSPAKRRGPVPGRVGQVRKANEALERQIASSNSSKMLPSQQERMMMGGMNDPSSMMQPQQALSSVDDLQLRQLMLAQQSQSAMGMGAGMDQGGWGGGGGGSMYDSPGSAGGLSMQQQAIQQQLNYLQQLQQQQQQLPMSENGENGNGSHMEQPSSQRVKMDPSMEAKSSRPDTISAHLHLLDKEDLDGNRLRAYYRLSIDELFSFPAVPSNMEYCNRMNIPFGGPLPKGLQHALLAARFSEVALGALVHDEVPLAMELCNATVHCLRECVQEPVDQSYLLEVSRAYFLLGVFRAFRGDMERYLKYRRVCMTHLSQLQEEKDQPVEGCEALLSAISYLDSWAYMITNANESALPNIDETIPPVVQSMSQPATVTEKKYDISTAPACIAADPKNQVWIQGAPPVYLNNEAPLPARALDALSCAVRSCCDQANSRFAALGKEVEATERDSGAATGESTASEEIPTQTIMTPTATAVLSHENELCSRNMVLSAYTLLQQFEASGFSPKRNQGLHLVISAMDAFLENGDDDGSGGFTESQIQSLLNVCNTVIESPLLLSHAGPTYHMVSNAAILLCHLLNGMHALRGTQDTSPDMETALFEEIFDTFISVRKLLNIHRRKLPVKLRCHGIPRPNIMGPVAGKAFIDLGETLMCACRGCQGFVLMACSPCVAAERARSAGHKRDMEAAREAESEEAEEMDKDLLDLGAEFDLDDDALLNMLSRIITA